MAAGQRGRATGLVLILVPVAALANLILISRFGALGAATAQLVTVLLGTLGAAVLAWQRFGPLIGSATLIRTAAAVAILALVDTHVTAISPWLPLKVLVLLGVYVLVLGTLKELRRDDMEALAIWRTAG